LTPVIPGVGFLGREWLELAELGLIVDGRSPILSGASMLSELDIQCAEHAFKGRAQDPR
jgi:hypothetical protein